MSITYIFLKHLPYLAIWMTQSRNIFASIHLERFTWHALVPSTGLRKHEMNRASSLQTSLSLL